MTEKVWNEVDNYITDLFIESDNILELSLKSYVSVNKRCKKHFRNWYIRWL